MSVSVCLSVCLCATKSYEARVQTASTLYACVLPMPVARSSPRDAAIYYALSVLPLTACNCTQQAIWRHVATVAANDVTASSRAG